MKKFSSFVFSETIFNQIDAMPKDLQLDYFLAVCRYGLYGISPAFEGLQESAWISMRDFIDFSASKRKANSENGQKGGAPIGNQNAVKVQPALFQPNVDEIIKEIDRFGIYVDTGIANSILNSDIDPLWLSPPYSYLEFIIEEIKERYGDKPSDQLRLLFITAIKTWDEKRREYPGWKAKKEKNAALDEAKKKKPEKCHCGGEIKEFGNDLICYSCYACYYFDNKKMEWVNTENRKIV